MNKYHPNASRPSGGFLFIELLFAIGMLAVASLLGAEIFRTAGQALTEAARQQTSELQIDQALGQLRSDVWGASAMESSNGHVLLVRSAGRGDVRWEANSVLARISPGDRPGLHWDRIDARITFDVHGPTLRVRVTQTSNEFADVVLVSQTLLLQGAGQ